MNNLKRFLIGTVAGAAILARVSLPAAADSTVTITGNTSPGENQEGWMFNRDASTSTPFEFNTTEASIGTGSLYVLPIGANASDKFIAENFVNTPIANVNSISYDFQIGNGGDANDEEHFYMNVYANFGSSPDDKFYDCRYNVIPTTGSTTDFTTVTFDPTQSYPVTTRTGAEASPFTCPAIPADMDDLSAGSNIRVFAINVGDTSVNDQGLDGYLDNVVVNLNDSTGVTTYDFEPFQPTGEITNPANDGDVVSGVVDFTAVYTDESDDVDPVQWAIRAGTCVAGTGTVAGNVDTFNDPFTWDGASFSASVDTTGFTPGNYCFVFNPTDDPGQNNVRETRNFVVEAPPVNPFFVPAECDQTIAYNLIEGNAGSNVLIGTNGPDMIYAGPGSDMVNGKGGNDCIVGEAGSDLLIGGAGDDVILGGDASDSIMGDQGNDKLYGGNGSDDLNGGVGDDQLWGEAGSDSLKGGNGSDKLDGGTGSDAANGNAGNDACIAEAKKSCEA